MAAIQPPNVNLNDNQSPQIIGSIIAVVVLSTLAVVGRLGARKILKRALDASDYTIISGLLAAWLNSAAIMAGAVFGIGKHIEVAGSNLTKVFLCIYLGEIPYSIGMTLIKISILLLYRSLFPSRNIRIATNILAGIVVSWGIAVFLVAVFTCSPVNGFWDFTIQATCIDPKAFYISNSVPNFLVDIVMLCLPVHQVVRLKMNLTQKVGVCCMFLLGGLVCIASIVRFVYLLETNIVDPTWGQTNPAKWTAVEINTGVISACLPTLRPLFAKGPLKFMSLGSWTAASNKSSHYVGPLQTIKSRSSRRADTDSLHRLPAHPHEEALSADSLKEGEYRATDREVNAEGSDLPPEFSV